VVERGVVELMPPVVAVEAGKLDGEAFEENLDGAEAVVPPRAYPPPPTTIRVRAMLRILSSRVIIFLPS